MAIHQPVDRAPIKNRNGADIRLFLGAESTYFAVDTTTREYVTNIDSATFRGWIWECIDAFDPRSTKTPILRKDYVPHSLVLGPDDMFCWISAKTFKVNNAFRSAFPSIERFLTYSKAKKILGKVVSYPSSLLVSHVNATRRLLPTRIPSLARSFHTTFYRLLTACASVPCLRALQISFRSTAHAGVHCAPQNKHGKL